MVGLAGSPSTVRHPEFPFALSSNLEVHDELTTFYLRRYDMRPDPTREMVVNTDANLLLITASGDSTRQLERLVNVLDVDVSDTKSSTDEGNRNRR